MANTLSFFPVGNGDMTLVELESGRKMLFDLNIRAAADDSDSLPARPASAFARTSVRGNGVPPGHRRCHPHDHRRHSHESGNPGLMNPDTRDHP